MTVLHGLTSCSEISFFDFRYVEAITSSGEKLLSKAVYEGGDGIGGMGN